MDEDRIIAVGLLTRHDLSLLGPAFNRAWPIEDVPEFDDLLRAIDDADERIDRCGEATHDSGPR